MPTSRPTLSVVVPIHNAEAYLGPCLASLADQTLTDLEVIMVDDGSADNGAVIAKAQAARDERFQLIERENQGPGPARNEGVRHATGRYLAFADADDLVPPAGYERLVRSLEKTGSDLATGNVMNIGEYALTPRWSRLHAGVFARRVARTHISDHPLLVRDRAASNKVFRREFWDRQGLEFPAGLYEDRPVIMRAHLLADAVDVRSETVYYWRRHAAAINENRFDLANLEQRLISAGGVRAVLEELAPSLLPGYDQHLLLGVELRVLLEMLRGIPEAQRSRFVALGAALIKGAGPGPVSALPAIDRLKWYLLGEEREAELLEVLRFQSLGGPRKTGTVRQLGRWYAPYPFFRETERAIPDRLYDVTAEVTAVARVDRAEWAAERPGILRLEGHAFLRHLDASARQDTRLRLWLVPTSGWFGRWGRLVRVALPLRQVARPDVTAGSRQSAVSHEWSGFATEIELDRLRLLGRWRAVEWKVVVEITTRGVTRTCILDEPPPGCRLWAAHHDVSDGVRVQPVLVDKHFMLQVRPVGALVTGHRAIDGELEIEGWTSEDPGTKSSVAFRHGGRKVRVAAQITTRPDGRFGFRARLPLADLTAAPADRLTGVTEAVTRLGDGLDWDLTVPGGQRALLSSAAGEARYPVADGTAELALTRTKHGVLCGVERSPRPTVTSVRWADRGALLLSGEYSGADRPAALILRHARSGEEHRSPLSWEGDRFAASLTADAVPFFGVPGPLSAGAWDLYAVTAHGEVAVVIERGAIRDIPGPRTTGCVEVVLRVRRVDALQLGVRAALADEERGRYAQARLATGYYQARRAEPLLDLVLFDAYKGKQFACNPRGVFEELRRRDLRLDLVWVSENGRFAVPDGVRTVQAGSRQHYEALARARYVVGNSAQQPWFEKREGQTYLQCWHGTPLKRIGFDVLEMPRRRLEGMRWMEYDVARWDLLLSQNAFSTPLLRRAFRYEGEVLESGYPRNDLLVGPERARMAADVRRRLGIPPGRKVVLYAPTWRDELHVAMDKRAFKLELDLERARAALSRDHVLLLRTHYLVTDRSPVRGDDFVLDVSRYPDITELYLISDVLITDYSSAMFDFAVTGRPILFFTYDLERYRDDVRGFYFDLEAEAPGPLLRTCEAVLDAVRHLDDTAVEAYRDRYAAFTARFCPFDDGHAGRRVVDRLLG